MKIKKLKGIGTVKYLLVIQLEGYIHLVDPIALLWASFSKGKTGPAKKSHVINHNDEFKSDNTIVHPQC